jgi:hypothetical protein
MEELIDEILDECVEFKKGHKNNSGVIEITSRIIDLIEEFRRD